MAIELEHRTWKAIFEDLSFDAARPFLSLMGLLDPDDPEFVRKLRSLIERDRGQPANDGAISRFVEEAFALAGSFGLSYSSRVRDWGTIIYPSSSPHQDQVYRWELIVTRGGVDGRRDVGPAPDVVRRVRESWSRRGKVSADQLRPLSDWDRQLLESREDDGLNPFEWIEFATRNFGFLASWDEATSGSFAKDWAEEVYRWALSEAVKLRLDTQSLDRPELYLRLPISLK